MQNAAPRPTLEQVATAAGVSKATASKVLNGRPNVSADTRRRVQEAIDRLGYTPTTGPRPAQARPCVSLVFRGLNDLFGGRVLEGVVAEGRDQGVDVVVDAELLDAGGPVPLSPGWIRAQAALQRTGIILVTTEIGKDQERLLRSHRLPVVHIDPLDPFDQDMVSVSSTNFAGGVQATDHLLGLGHRRIAFAGGEPTSVPVRERLQGYRAALAQAEVPFDERLVTLGGHGHAVGIADGLRLLGLTDPPTAVFAVTDATALGVLEAARQRGLRCPEDLSVVGFDDTYAAITASPALTTVRQPITEMGRVALRTLLGLARGERGSFHHMQLSTQLMVRESTAPPSR